MGVSGYTVRSGSAFKNKKRGPKALPFVDISKWDIVPAEPRHWLVYDRIPRRQPTIFSGHGEAGKSTLLLQLLCSTVLGRDWVGLLPEQGPAIYFCAEEEEDELHRRLDPILKHHSARYADLVAGGFKLMSYAGKDMVLGIVDKQGRVEATDLLRDLYHEAYALQPKLIAIDGLSDIYFCKLTAHDVVRHKLVADIVDAYARYDASQAATETGRLSASRARRDASRNR